MTRKQLIAKAEQHGLWFNIAGTAAIIITRKGRRAASVALWNNGAITRNDIDLTLAKRMTVTEAAKVLGLKP